MYLYLSIGDMFDEMSDQRVEEIYCGAIYNAEPVSALAALEELTSDRRRQFNVALERFLDVLEAGVLEKDIGFIKTIGRFMCRLAVAECSNLRDLGQIILISESGTTAARRFRNRNAVPQSRPSDR